MSDNGDLCADCGKPSDGDAHESGKVTSLCFSCLEERWKGECSWVRLVRSPDGPDVPAIVKPSRKSVEVKVLR